MTSPSLNLWSPCGLNSSQTPPRLGGPLPTLSAIPKQSLSGEFPCLTLHRQPRDTTNRLSNSHIRSNIIFRNNQGNRGQLLRFFRASLMFSSLISSPRCCNSVYTLPFPFLLEQPFFLVCIVCEVFSPLSLVHLPPAKKLNKESPSATSFLPLLPFFLILPSFSLKLLKFILHPQ